MEGHIASSVAYDFSWTPSRAHPTNMPFPGVLIFSFVVLYVDGKNVCVAPESSTASLVLILDVAVFSVKPP